MSTEPARCEECGTVTELGWAQVCHPCWDEFFGINRGSVVAAPGSPEERHDEQ